MEPPASITQARIDTILPRPLVVKIASNFIRRYGHEFDMDDLCQEGLLHVMRKLPLYDSSKGKLKEYCVAQLAFGMTDYIRNISRRKRLDYASRRRVAQPEATFDEFSDGWDSLHELYKLPLDERELLELSFRGLTQRQIADYVGEAEHSVGRKMRRARASLGSD